jgi:hypothetical protein
MKIAHNTGPALLVASAFFAVLLLTLRVLSVFSLSQPMQVVTSGFEEESLFAIWKGMHQLPVFADPHQIPFAASYFNWLFYTFYSKVVGFLISFGDLDDLWIPTIGRGVTLAIAIVGSMVNYRLLTRALVAPWLALCLSIWLWLGPLLGFWTITVRPDIGALFFEGLAAFWILRSPQHNVFRILLAAGCCYLAWSCKQIAITMPIAIVLFLAWERNWKGLGIFVLALMSAYAATLGLASIAMRDSLFQVKHALAWSWQVWAMNLLNFAKKSSPVLLLAAYVGVKSIDDPQARNLALHNPLVRLGLCGSVAWGITLLPASSKIGSADNYHFIALFYLVLMVGGAFAAWRKMGVDNIAPKAFAVAGVMGLFSIGVVIVNGQVATVAQQHQQLTALKDCIAPLPKPVFVMNHYAALPWMNPGQPSFVLAFNYWEERLLGRTFAHNGIGGLITQGYFSTLVLPANTQNVFDGASLKNYTRQTARCNNYLLFTRNDA